MMNELRRLKLLLDRLGVRVKAELITSVVNKFADGLLERFPAAAYKSASSCGVPSQM